MGLIKAIRKPESMGRRFSPHKKMDYSAMSNGTGDTEAINSKEDSFDETKFYASLVERNDEETPVDEHGFPIVSSAPDVFVAFPTEGSESPSKEVSPLKSPPKADLKQEQQQEEEEEVLPTFLSISVDSINEDAFLAGFAETEFPPSPQKEESTNGTVVNEDNKNEEDWGGISRISVASSHSDGEAETLQETLQETKPEPIVPKSASAATRNDTKSTVRNLVHNFNSGSKVKNMASAFEGSKTNAPAPVRAYRRTYIPAPAAPAPAPAPAAAAAAAVSPETTKNERFVKLKPVNRTTTANSKQSSIQNLIQNFNNGKPTATDNSSNKVEAKETNPTIHLFKHLDENNKVVNKYVSFNNVDSSSRPKLATFENFHQDVDLLVSTDNSADIPNQLVANSRLELELEPAETSTSTTSTTVTNNTTTHKTPVFSTTRAVQKQFTSIEESIRLSCETFNRNESPDTSFDSALTSPSQCSSVFSVFVSNTLSKQFADSVQQIKSEFNEFCDDHAAMFAKAASRAEKEVEAFLSEPPPRPRR